jgi:PAS domain S-box-containing protein
VLAVILSLLGFSYFFAKPLHSVYVQRSDLPEFLIFASFAGLVSWFSAIRRRIEQDLIQTRDKLKVEKEEVEKRSSLLDLTHDSIFVRDMNFIISYWNRGAEEFYGWKQNEAIGKRSDQLLRTKFPKSIEELRAELLREDGWEGELTRTKADGGQVIVASRWSLRRDPQGSPVAILETSNDISERKIWEAEEAARRSEKELRDAIEIIPAMVFIALPGASNAFVSRPWREYTGLSAQDTAGSGWQAAVHPEDLQRHVKKWEVSSATGEPFEDEARFRRAVDGEYRWFLIRAVPLQDDVGNVLKWYGVLTDIEDRKRAEEQRERLLQLEAELAHMDRIVILGELSASIAHEVNQPLSGIVSSGSACLRWLAADPPNLQEVGEAVRRIVGAGKHAGEVIARIRALTKRTEIPKEKLDLNETIREVLILVGNEAKRNKVIIRTVFADGLSPVWGDRVQLQQVLLNLVINGIEAMTNVTERTRELVITTRNIDPEQVQVTVEDSGIGIDASAIKKIFDPFYTTKSTGMGMGLSISRSILQRHNGRLWATTKDGVGTSFHFAVPKCHEEEPNAGAA